MLCILRFVHPEYEPVIYLPAPAGEGTKKKKDKRDTRKKKSTQWYFRLPFKHPPITRIKSQPHQHDVFSVTLMP
jgi:hypothetical protein